MMNDINGAKETLTTFIFEMNKWEVESYGLLAEGGTDEIKNKIKIELDSIFNTYCTLRDRKQGRQVSLSCSEPPEYSLDEEITSAAIAKNKAIIETQQKTGFENVFKYTLNHTALGWRIDKKERFSEFESKWVKYNI
ncbi:NTF2 fold immunity protein [Candidatus Pantoea multigeneris]|nr:NTF2 fold immunity protein [Pantoea multigeneris]